MSYACLCAAAWRSLATCASRLHCQRSRCVSIARPLRAVCRLLICSCHIRMPICHSRALRVQWPKRDSKFRNLSVAYAWHMLVASRTFTTSACGWSRTQWCTIAIAPTIGGQCADHVAQRGVRPRVVFHAVPPHASIGGQQY